MIFKNNIREVSKYITRKPKKIYERFRENSLDNYTKERFFSDLMAGAIVGIVALPLAIAFGIASGVSPEKGIITAIIGGFIVSLLGGSKVQIGGPTGAFIVIVYGIIQEFGIEGLAIATVMAGVMLLLMGILKVGVVIKFIPYPIVVGFTSGIALTIFTTQIKDFFGLSFTSSSTGFLEQWQTYAGAMHTINWWSLGISLFSLYVIIYSPRFFKRIPGSLIAIILSTVLVALLKLYGGITAIETIGDRFAINAAMPSPELLAIDINTINLLLPSAFAIAMLGAIESLLSATVADGVIGEKHNSNTELMAQGVANMVVPLFGGIPVTGAIARTMTNINNGGRSPIAGIVHAVVLLLILLFLMPLAKHIPMACLASVLVMVSYNMSEWRTFRSLLKNPVNDVIVLFTTFLLTVLFDLTIAIEIGLLIAMLLFLKRIIETSNITMLKNEIHLMEEEKEGKHIEVLSIPDGVEIYEIDGPFFFGIANKFDDVMSQLTNKTTVVRIIRMRKVPFMDSTGVHNLESLIRLSKKNNIRIVLSGVNEDVRGVLLRANVQTMIGEDCICSDIYEALEIAEKIKSNLESTN